jgi:hypothetical protein
MKWALVFCLLSMRVIAQESLVADWNISGTGNGASGFSQMTFDAQGNVYALGDFRRGDLEINGTTLTEDPNLMNSLVLATDNSGDVLWTISGLDKAVGMEVMDVSNSLLIAERNKWSAWDLSTGQSINTIQLANDPAGYAIISSMSKNGNGEILSAIEAEGSHVLVNADTLMFPSYGHFLVLISWDPSLSVQQHVFVPFDNVPLLEGMSIKGGANQFAVFVNADSIDVAFAGTHLNANAAVQNSPSRVMMLVCDAQLNFLNVQWFGSHNAGIQIEEINYDAVTQSFYMASNVYNENGAGNPFGMQIGMQQFNAPSNCDFFPVFFHFDENNYNVVRASCNVIGNAVLARSFRPWNNGDALMIFNSIQSFSLNNMNVNPDTDTNFNGDVYSETFWARVGGNGNVLNSGSLGMVYDHMHGQVELRGNALYTCGIAIDTDVDFLDDISVNLKRENFVEASSEGVLENTTHELQFFPNPVENAFQLTGIPPGASVSIWNAAGQLISTSLYAGVSMSLPENMTQGIYLISVSHGTEVFTSRMIKQ